MLFQKWIDKRIDAYQSDLLQKYCDEVESMYTKMRGWRHDYHNHIQAMQASMALGKYDEVSDYLRSLNDDLTNVDTTIKTGAWEANLFIPAPMVAAATALALCPRQTVKW